MKQFKCKHCGATRNVSFWKELNSFHLFGKWVYVKCPKCGKRSWMKKVQKEKGIIAKHEYTVSYVDFDLTCDAITIKAFSYKDLLKQIAKKLPKDVKYILSVSINKWGADYWRE